LPGKPRQASRQASSELLIGLCELCLSSGVEQIVGLYERQMVRVYANLGWSPAPLATSCSDAGDLIVGIWDVSRRALEDMWKRTPVARLPELKGRAA
jgi:N-acyl-L-homoserine lactone synthetase